LTPPALVIGFPDGRVVLRARQASAHLGRAGAYGHLFGRYPNVSRQHATVIVDGDGDVWIEPNPTAPNGTFVNDTEILTRTQVHPGDQIRFAADHGPHLGPVSTQIRQPQRER
jgi:pSer/pThr/pTyr-binding forkhead associated (FHA) protein